MDESDQPDPLSSSDTNEPPDGYSVHLRLLAEKATERLKQDLMARDNSARIRRSGATEIGDAAELRGEDEDPSSISLRSKDL